MVIKILLEFVPKNLLQGETGGALFSDIPGG